MVELGGLLSICFSGSESGPAAHVDAVGVAGEAATEEEGRSYHEGTGERARLA